MKTLTREEIQALSEAELNQKLFNIHYEALEGDYDFKTLRLPSYCKSLDAQFELAEKFGFCMIVTQLPDGTFIFVIKTRDHENELYDLLQQKFYYKKHLDKPPSKTKRAGAELLLEAIQELEVKK